MVEPQHTVYGVADTHKHFRAAAAVDDVGQTLGSKTFPTTAAGYRCL